MAAQHCAFPRHQDPTIDQDCRREHLVDQLLIGQIGIVEAEFVIGRTCIAQQIAHTNAHRLDELAQFSSDGGVFRYSMISGSTPLRRIMASTFREVPQSGLW